MNVSPAFCGIVRRALASYIVINLWKHFDPRKGTYSLLSHLEWVSNHLQLFSAESYARRQGVTIEHPLVSGFIDLAKENISEFKKKLAVQTVRMDGLKALRYNIFAHRSKSLLEINYEDVPLTLIEEAFGCINGTLNQISQYWDRTTYIAELANTGDIRDTLEIIKQYRQNGGYHWAFQDTEIAANEE